MPELAAPPNAFIQIETGVEDGHPEAHRVLIDGRNVSHQVRSIRVTLDAGEVADVQVTYARPHLSLTGDVHLVHGEVA